MKYLAIHNYLDEPYCQLIYLTINKLTNGKLKKFLKNAIGIEIENYFSIRKINSYIRVIKDDIFRFNSSKKYRGNNKKSYRFNKFEKKAKIVKIYI